jgi:hypothetical protein
MAAGTLKMWNADRGFGFIQMMRADQTFFFTSPPCKTPASTLTKSEGAFGLHTRLKIPATARRRLAAFDWLESHAGL